MKRPVEKFKRIMKATYDWIKDAAKFITTVIAWTTFGICFWLGFALVYVGSAKFVGEWLRLVSTFMNGGSI